MMCLTGKSTLHEQNTGFSWCVDIWNILAPFEISFLLLEPQPEAESRDSLDLARTRSTSGFQPSGPVWILDTLFKNHNQENWNANKLKHVFTGR